MSLTMIYKYTYTVMIGFNSNNTIKVTTTPDPCVGVCPHSAWRLRVMFVSFVRGKGVDHAIGLTLIQ